MALTNDPPISAEEMTRIAQHALSLALLLGSDDAPAPDGTSFELVTPATGQRFRFEVTEVTP